MQKQNAPFNLPYKKQGQQTELEKLQKQLHFLETRVKELELTLMEFAEEEDEDMSQSLDTEDSPIFSRKKAKTGEHLFEKKD